ncbi:hypothetical protein Rsub_13242 [Raphidocelis subcapitata]|uniref:Uncharacterized protein n=1 Tax=Raphidocelis subcapitata TaxID=307507 RepID=A0A2V0PL64_9CHLO|nr:hypothetical protein Rsub_13242 [Raphidocelis subcapitata]|eukprot:GBG00539.1 hypothetical protein Rsub_13242 [Raphidocelis subcapitata]
MGPRGLAALLAVMLLARTAFADSIAGCPSACPSLPQQQRSAAALAVSLVAFVGCKGDLDGAARAIISAASSGDADAFSAGMSIGAASLTGAGNEAGQMAEALTQTLTVANADNKAKAVASAVGSSIQAMQGPAQAAMMGEAISALNDVADGGQCGLAGMSAFEMFRALRASDKKSGAKLLALSVAKGRSCWTRRLLKLAASPLFARPPPVSPCASYMRNASAVSVSLLTASSCGLPSDKKLDAAATALVTAASRGGCSFASAVTSVSLSGVADKSGIISVYTSAIPKARAAGASDDLANAFASAMYEVTGVQGDASGLLSDLVAAISGTVRTSGCAGAKEFAEGVYGKLAEQDPEGKAELAQAFQAAPAIAACKYALA